MTELTQGNNKAETKLARISWLGTCATLLAAFLLSLNIPEVSKWAYFVYPFGCFSWAWVAHKRGDRALLTVNLVFMVTDCIGVWRWWLAPLFA